MKTLKKFKEDEDFRNIIFIVISGISLLLSMLKIIVLPFGVDFAWVAIILSGYPIVKEAVIDLVTEFNINASVLVSIALIAAVIIGQYFAAGEVAFIMMIGELLENMTVKKAYEGLSKMVKLAPQTARILTNGIECETSIENVNVGDTLIVRVGETIPVDGTIMNGFSSIDQSIITGESMPVDKGEGDEVYVGTINCSGILKITASQVGENSSLGKMIKLVKEAEEKKAKIAKVADKWAAIMVPMALIFALLTYLGATYYPHLFSFIVDMHSRNVLSPIVRAVTILVVFCPCALVLATPTAIMAAIGNATKHGILIKSGLALETMSRVNVVAFDKTGTVTRGKPQVVSIVSFDTLTSEDEILSIIASGEVLSEHPLGRAVVKYAEANNTCISPVHNFSVTLGKGITGNINDKDIYIGSEKLLSENGIHLNETQANEIEAEQTKGRSIILLADKARVLGYMAVADTLKPHTPHAINSLRDGGINEIILLTGDNETTSHAIAKEANITTVFASQLPSDKANVIKNLIENGKYVAMIGDGVNDAPAIATASVGIAMGAMGTDIAIEAADIALMSDEIDKLPEIFTLAKTTMKTIKFNIAVSMGINLIAIVFASLGLMGPVVGALVHNVGSVLVTANSALLLRYKFKG